MERAQLELAEQQQQMAALRWVRGGDSWVRPLLSGSGARKD